MTHRSAYSRTRSPYIPARDTRPRLDAAAGSSLSSLISSTNRRQNLSLQGTPLLSADQEPLSHGVGRMHIADGGVIFLLQKLWYELQYLSAGSSAGQGARLSCAGVLAKRGSSCRSFSASGKRLRAGGPSAPSPSGFWLGSRGRTTCRRHRHIY